MYVVCFNMKSLLNPLEGDRAKSINKKGGNVCFRLQLLLMDVIVLFARVRT